MLTRLLNIKSPALEICQPLLTSVKGHDYLSYPFEFELDLCSATAIDLDTVLGQTVAFSINQYQQSQTYHGVIEKIIHTENTPEGPHYTLSVCPWFKTLQLISDYRCFVNQSVIEVVTTLFNHFGCKDYDLSKLSKTYPKLSFCMQYDETVFNFISRLLEVHNIYYYFTHTDKQHVMVLEDSGYFNHLAYPTPLHYEREHHQDMSATHWQHLSTPGFGPNTLHLGASLNPPAIEMRKHYHGASMNAYILPQGKVSSNYIGLHPGCQFSFSIDSRCFNSQQGQHYVYAMEIEAVDESHRPLAQDQPLAQHYYNTLSTYPANLPFAPINRAHREQHIKLFKPTAYPNTAKIVGPKGLDIHSNEWAHVKIQFHFDRYGQWDENSSAWVPTHQTWTGQNMGWVCVPRIGEEVLVDFENGDPDKPIVIASLPNAAHPPIFKPDCQMGIHTHTLGSDDPHQGHRLCMDDTPQQELFTLSSSRDFDLTVEGHSQHIIGNNLQMAVAQDYTHEVKGDLKIEAKQQISIRCGTSALIINHEGIILQADSIELESVSG